MAGASVVVFTQYDVWAAFAASEGNPFVATESFEAFSGFVASGETGDIGGISWTVTSERGLWASGSPTYLATNVPTAPMNFVLGEGVMGIGGNFFATDNAFLVAPATVQVSLDDGTTYVGSIDSADAYVGFYSLDVAIAGISISVEPASPGEPLIWATIDNLYIAIPSPASIALLGLAGLVARRRRRN